jgi:hypothetical protein
MTQEEKRLLEIELATRSQYGIICAIKPATPYHDLDFSGKKKIKNILIRENDSIFTFGPYEVHGVENIRPYLRPMSSMTAEEKQSYYKLIDNLHFAEGSFYSPDIKDWLDERFFDYRSLIEKGLALEAPEGMYKTK